MAVAVRLLLLRRRHWAVVEAEAVELNGAAGRADGDVGGWACGCG